MGVLCEKQVYKRGVVDFLIGFFICFGKSFGNTIEKSGEILYNIGIRKEKFLEVI